MTFLRPAAIALFSVTSVIACGASQPAPIQPATTASADAGPTAAIAKDAPSPEDDSPIPISPRDPTWGARTAPVTIVSFSDFQCPFCARAEQTIAKLETEYGPEKLRVVWKNEPLPFHPNARPAAEAAMGIFALGGNDAFWRFEETAFRHQDQLSNESYERWAELANVDIAQLRRGLLAHTWAPKIEEDHALATKVGVYGTPAFYINGVSLGGAQPFPKFTAIIDEELRKANALVAAGTPVDRVYVASSTVNWKNRPPPSDDEADDDDAPDTRVWRVPVGSAPVLGPKNAPVTIIEYSDFQCPFCERAQGTLKQVRARYGDKVRFVWKNEPLPFHPRALPAAELALEARAQKGDAAFWAAHDKLFEGQKNLEDADLAAIAKGLGLDVKKVEGAIAMQRYKRAIEADVDEAAAFQANGTPHFFINGRRLVGAQPFEKFQAMIDEEIVKASALVAKGIPTASIYDALTKDGSLPPPPAMKTVALAKDAPVRGSASARVVIQEFSDFQCPFCKRVEATLDDVMKTYGGRAKLVWRNTPLAIHPNAEPAAEAAMEAYAQKGNAGFWKMHDLLFTNQGAPDGLSRESLDKYARQLGLDMTKFAAAIDGHSHQAAIDADAKAASDAGISGTPSFVINGYYVSGAQPYGKFREAIERALSDGAAPKGK